MSFFRKQPWVNIALFEEKQDGEMLVEILRSKGFETRVYFDRVLQMFLFLCPPRAMHRTQVRANDSKVVTHFLNTDPKSAPALERAIHCPSCGSMRVNYPQMTRKFFLPTLLLHAGIILRIIGHEAYCEHCHHTWNLSEAESPQLTKAKPAH
jgi:hypothetical protein